MREGTEPMTGLGRNVYRTARENSKSVHYCTATHKPTGERVYCELTTQLVYAGLPTDLVVTYRDVGPGEIIFVAGATLGDLANIEPE